MQKSKEYELEKLFGLSSREQLTQDLQKAEEEIENGEGIDADIFFKEMREKYEYKHR